MDSRTAPPIQSLPSQTHTGNHSFHLWTWLIAFLVVIIIVFIVVIVATRRGKACTSNDQCSTGQVCSGGICKSAGVISCSNASDCPTGQICQNSVCIVPSSVKCTVSSQCPLGSYCNTATNTCQTQGGKGIVGSPCLKPTDCNTGLYCSGANTCQNNSTNVGTGTCTSSDQCLVGNYCNSTTSLCTPGTGSLTGQVCSQASPCPTGFCSSAQICQPGVPLLPGKSCTSLAQCGAINGVQYYCDLSSVIDPVCDSADLSYQIAPAFTNMYLVTNQGETYLSVFNPTGQSQPFTMSLTAGYDPSGNDATSITLMQYTPGAMSVAETSTGNPFTGLLGIASNGLLIAGSTTPSVVYLMELLYNKTNNIGYVLIDQYGNPLVASPFSSGPNARNPYVGFYDPVHYPNSPLTDQDSIIRFGIVNYAN